MSFTKEVKRRLERDWNAWATLWNFKLLMHSIGFKIGFLFTIAFLAVLPSQGQSSSPSFILGKSLPEVQQELNPGLNCLADHSSWNGGAAPGSAFGASTIFSLNEALGNGAPQKVENVLKPLSLSQVFSSTEVFSGPDSRNSFKAWALEDLAFFCRLEVRMERAAGLPVKFRLGEVQYTERMEGKQ